MPQRVGCHGRGHEIGKLAGQNSGPIEGFHKCRLHGREEFVMAAPNASELELNAPVGWDWIPGDGPLDAKIPDAERLPLLPSTEV